MEKHVLVAALLCSLTCSSSSKPPSTPPTINVQTDADVLQRSMNPSRDGLFLQPPLTRVNASKLVREPNFAPTFNGDMWASPLFMQNGPGGKSAFFVVTTTNDVYAFDELTGAMLWTHNVGTPAMLNGPTAPCGSIHPLGIIATPVIDAQARTIFLSAAVGSATAIERQEVHALSIDDGQERAGWPVDVSARFMFNPQSANPRSALSLVNGIVYVAYGGHFGDCGDYKGRVIAIDSTDPTKAAMFVTGGLGEAIWAAGGMPSDGNAIFAVTGNRHMGSGAHQDSEQVTRVTGMAVVNRTPDDTFYPASWQMMDDMDLDLGSSNAVLIDVPGATPSGMVVSLSEDGHFYLLDRAHFGGLAGQLVDLVVAAPAMSISTVPTAYTTPSGVHVAFTVVGTSVGCPASAGMSPMVLSVLVGPGGPATPTLTWCAPIAGSGAPMTTTTDGMNESIVWYTTGDQQATLTGVDGETGQAVYTGTEPCGVVQKWMAPVAVHGRIIVGATGRLCAYSAP